MKTAFFTGNNAVILSMHPGGGYKTSELTVPHFFSFVEQRFCMKKNMGEASQIK